MKIKGGASVMEPLLIPNSIIDGVIVVVVHLTHNKGSELVGGKLLFSRILHVDLFIYLILGLKLLFLD